MTAAALPATVLTQLSRHVSLEEIPSTEDLLSSEQLEEWLLARSEPPLDLLVGGDVMLAGRSQPLLAAHGPGYPFEAVAPLLNRASVVLANLEGPLARNATKRSSDRNFSYRVAPLAADALAEAGIRLLTLANNHLMDCGPEGVLETLDVLESADIKVVGAGVDSAAAHAPAILSTPGGTLGVLGYYWNRRCAATATRAGGAMDDPASLERDIPALRRQVDFLVVTEHWGVPYDRGPSAAERERARRAIDLGADAVVAHHPHVIQPCEIYRGRPIFYSIGNFAFGSGNSKAEGLLVGFRCTPAELGVEVYPLYVKNRDPRVNYQPKVVSGLSARRAVGRLFHGETGAASGLTSDGPRAVLRLARSTTR
jgi:poly-gamma-glutamate capsule biosynthesis protein CapA/YwtB (metallophosphatase superfamily)